MARIDPPAAAAAPGPLTVALRYETAEAARRDRLADVPYGLLVKVARPAALGEPADVAVEIAEGRVALRLRGEVRWVTPLLSGALVGIALEPSSHRERVQLDLLFGHRSAGATPEPHVPRPSPAAPGAPPLPVVLLQPNPVLRQALLGALGRYGRERAGRDVAVEATSDKDAFLEALAARTPGLAVIDCDALPNAADALVTAIRSHDAWERLPLVLLSSHTAAHLTDAFAVHMHKPVSVKSFGDVVGLLLAAA